MRYDLEFAPSLVGSDSEMVARSDGDWVLYVSHLAEARQTQRRMIAALYWRAGVARHLADVSTVRGQTGRYLQMHDTLVHAARAMEAACAR